MKYGTYLVMFLCLRILHFLQKSMVTEVRHELPREASKLARGYVDGSQSAPVAFNSER